MDWNGDGEYDWQDDAIYLSIIEEIEKEEAEEENNSSVFANTSTNFPRFPQEKKPYHITKPGWVVIVIVVFLLLNVPFSGLPVLGTAESLVAWGIAIFLFVQWISKG